MRDKALKRAEMIGLKPADLARAMQVPQPRISEWANPPGRKQAKGEKRIKTWKPNAVQAMALARKLGVDMESLIDDEMELVTKEDDEDDRFVLRTYRALGLSANDAVRLLNAGVVIDSGGVRFRGVETVPTDSGRPSERRSG